jgi:hypothetical protein
VMAVTQAQAQVLTRVLIQMGVVMGERRKGRRLRRLRRVLRGSRSLRCVHNTDYKSPHDPLLTIAYL